MGARALRWQSTGVVYTAHLGACVLAGPRPGAPKAAHAAHRVDLCAARCAHAPRSLCCARRGV